MKKNSQKVYAVILLQPTTPFRTNKHVDGAINKFLKSNKNVLASVSGPHKKRDVIIKKIDDFGNLVNYKKNDKNMGFYEVKCFNLYSDKRVFIKREKNLLRLA